VSKTGYRAVAVVLMLLSATAQAAATRKVVGQTFPIAEPDTLEEITRIAAGTDWQRWMRRQPKDYSAFDSASLPRNTQAGSYLFDPTYTLPEDLVNERGEVLVGKGTRVNALEKIRLPGRYIVIGATAEDYRWLDEVARPESRDKVLVASGNVLTEREETGRPLYALDDRFVERFGLRGVPSIVQQQGTQLRVDAHVIR
jgi:conjugal transfer pilus assembly protein TraW